MPGAVLGLASADETGHRSGRRREPAGPALPCGADSLFPIGSVTKVYEAALAALARARARRARTAAPPPGLPRRRRGGHGDDHPAPSAHALERAARRLPGRLRARRRRGPPLCRELRDARPAAPARPAHELLQQRLRRRGAGRGARDRSGLGQRPARAPARSRGTPRHRLAARGGDPADSRGRASPGRGRAGRDDAVVVGPLVRPCRRDAGRLRAGHARVRPPAPRRRWRTRLRHPCRHGRVATGLAEGHRARARRARDSDG